MKLILERWNKFLKEDVDKDKKREISRDEAVSIIIDGIPNNVRRSWLRDANRAAKPKIEQRIVNNPELLNATLNIFHQQYQIFVDEEIDFSEFLDMDITLYRAGTTPETEVFSSYTFDEEMANKHSIRYNLDTHSITVKPRDTYGMINETAEGEVLVPLKTQYSDKFQEGEVFNIKGHDWTIIKRAGRQVHLQRTDKPDSNILTSTEDRLAQHIERLGKKGELTNETHT